MADWPTMRYGASGIAAAVAFLAMFWAVRASAGAPQLHFAGEYGLRVWFTADTVHVGWLTERPEPGRLEVRAGDRTLLDARTPAGFTHRGSFVRTGSHDVVLRYGILGDELHETQVDLDVGRKRSGVVMDAPDSLFVIGDVHGEFDTLTAVLHNAGLIDGALRWTGGRSRLVVAGDMMDRGLDVTRLLWFLHGLERQADEAGGGVDVLLGNHELMVMTGDVRYVSAKENEVARLHGVDYARFYDPRSSLLGRWLTSKPGMVRIGEVLIAHGGVSTAWLGTTLEAFDDTLDAYTHDDAFWLWADTTAALPLDSAAFERRNAFFWEPTSVFWYRGYAQSDTLGRALDDVLEHFEARVHVVGHTPGDAVREAYDGRLILTNTAPFGRELLLLVRAGDDRERFRIGTEGPPRPVAVPAATSSAGRSP